MGKDKVEKKEKRAEKKEKRAEKDGVHKSKKDKKEKKDKTALADAVEKEITSQVLEGLDQAAAAGAAEVEVDAMAVDRPVGAVVPFANPLVEDKQAKKVLKSVKKGMLKHFRISGTRFVRFMFLLDSKGPGQLLYSLRAAPIAPAQLQCTTFFSNLHIN